MMVNKVYTHIEQLTYAGGDSTSGSALALVSTMAVGLAPGLTSGLGSSFGWKGASALRAISTMIFLSSSFNFAAVSSREFTSIGIFSAAACTACAASVILSSGTGSNRFTVSASRTVICAGTASGAASGCLRQA